jgi:hypothetical protein
MAAHRASTRRDGEKVGAVADVADPEVVGDRGWVSERHCWG